MRRNLLGTRLALRVALLRDRAERTGTIFVTPGHEGTSSTCPSCRRVEKKALTERRHDCPCGLSTGRDHASALETTGRALLPFRLSPDPDGRIAAGVAKREAARVKAVADRARKAERSRVAAAKRRDAQSKAGPPGHRAVVSPVPPSPQPSG